MIHLLSRLILVVHMSARRRRCSRHRGRMIVIFIGRMNMFGFLGHLYACSGRYADENISPHATLRMAANGAEVFVSSGLYGLENDLFCIARTGAGVALELVAAGSFSDVRRNPELAHDVPKAD